MDRFFVWVWQVNGLLVLGLVVVVGGSRRLMIAPPDGRTIASLADS